jgi:hypothetical protein
MVAMQSAGENDGSLKRVTQVCDYSLDMERKMVPGYLGLDDH